MQRQSFFILTAKGIGSIVLGNVLCLFMTMGMAMFGANWFFNMLSLICGVLIFYLLVFTAAWKDGVRERSLVRLKRVEREKKYRWIFIGLIMFAFAAAPTFILLLNKLFFPQEDTLYLYRLICGSAYPFVMTFIPPVITESEAWTATTLRQIDNMSALFPALMLLYYAAIPVVTQLGWWCGFNDKLNMDKIMYK